MQNSSNTNTNTQSSTRDWRELAKTILQRAMALKAKNDSKNNK